jgi:hypothetical protein
VDSFERALASPTFKDPLTGWRKYADEDAFIDYFLLNELTKNVDAYTLSTFFFKDKNSNGGKLQMGPNWDYNLAWRNADYCTGDLADGWIYRKNDVCQTDMSFWWKRFMQDAAYKNRMKCRWIELRSTVFDTAYIFNKMDSIANYLGASKERHFRQWPILGTYVWPNPAPLADTYTEELDNTKQWITARLNWMDSNLPGICSPVSDETVFEGKEFSVYPNPVAETLNINIAQLRSNKLTVKVYDALGQAVLLQHFNTADNDTEVLTIDLKAVPKGFYFIEIGDNSGAMEVQKIVKL